MTRLINAHMPFVTRINGRKVVFFAASGPYSEWKIHYSDYDNWEPKLIDLKSGEQIVECAPAVFVEPGGMINLSAVVGYKLLHMRALTIEELPATQYRVIDVWCSGGYVSPNYVAWSDHREVHLANRATGLKVKFTPFFEDPMRFRITRLSFMPEDETKLIVTAADMRQIPSSLLIDLTDGRRWEVWAANSPVYKMALFEGELVHAVKHGVNFESRTLVSTTDFVLSPLEKITYEDDPR